MRKIIHVDMDCFYAAVEEKHNPDLRGKPVGIGGPPNSRSVLCTANYEARKYKVRSAMPSSHAVRLCPELILIPPNFERYKAESRVVREIFHRFTSLVEPLSLDEAYLDVTHCQEFHGSATLIAREIRSLIAKECQLTASAGIATNKFLAKIASDWNKPNGQFVILPEQVDAFMKPLEVGKIYGVGQVTQKKMHSLGLYTCGDIQKQSSPHLEKWFGSRAEQLAQLARGIDDRPVETKSERKSLTVEETFSRDLNSLELCLNELPALYQDWQSRMSKLKNNEQIRGHIVKLRYFDFKSTTHEVSARSWPSEQDFAQLLKNAWQRRAQPIRLLGIGVRLMSTSNELTDLTSQPDEAQLQLNLDLNLN